VELTVSPTDGLVDEVPSIVVRGLPPGRILTVRVEVPDAAGVTWRSVNHYPVDSEGVVDSATTAPREGTYAGVDAAGPWWSMTPLVPGEPLSAFAAYDDALVWSVECDAVEEVPGARRTVVRRWRGQDVARSDIVFDGVRHATFSPASGDRAPAAVVLVPGDTGSETLAPTAALLASRCRFSATVLTLPGGDDRGPPPREVPVEGLARGIAGAIRAAGPPPRAAVVAYSTGAAGALAALALERVPVNAVVAIAAPHVVWQAAGAGGARSGTSAWSYLGDPLPYVPLRDQPEGQAPPGAAEGPPEAGEGTPTSWMRSAYDAGLRDRGAVGAAGIPVERIAAPLMAVAGTADEVWPAEDMARGLIERHAAAPQAHAGPHGDVLLINRDAGHVLRPPLIPTTVRQGVGRVSAGTAAADAVAQTATWLAMTRFLRHHLAPP
jgi:Acyl-CoA thioester hydrolase/BAAT N-terminal region/BAAT / Acyl-CoA thioester hydrolase C terminal